MQTAAADPLVGRTLEGRYRIQAGIARGGMSTVYRAVDQRLDRLVAVKVMTSALSADPAFVERFAREAQLAAKLSHVNAVSVFDQGTDAGHVFLVMELVRGRTLRDLIRERGALAPAAAVSIMEQALSALAAAHRAGLAHRDVKPENILLSDDGVVKVADFGLAHAVEADPSAASRTGVMMGTVAYCPPEQISRGCTDQRSDVYSAGVVLFELLTGETPYVGESAMAVAYQHLHNRVPAPSSRIGRRVPEELDDLVVRATDRDPAGRPLDAGAFLAELHDVRTDLGLPVVPVPPRPRVGPDDGAGGVARAGVTERIPPGQRSHDTAIAQPVAGRGQAGWRPGDTAVAAVAEAPPRHPSIPPRHPSIPPPATSAPLPRRRNGARRALIVVLVLLLLGAMAGYGAWWFASGRYKHVPQVGGESRGTALAALGGAGLRHVAVQDTYSESVGKDAVIDTTPGAGARVLPNNTITLRVSLGPQRCALPTVAGGNEAQARATLARCNFALQVQLAQQPSDTAGKGTVLGTDPPKGTAVKPGQAVTIVVSTGPPMLAVPDVRNQDQDDATNTLQDAGFKVAVNQAFSSSVPEGDVISQSPSASGQAVKFSTIALTVSQGPPLVTVPSIVAGTPTDDAQSTLQGLGLNVKIRKQFGAPLGIVVGMDPQAGTQLHQGDTVTLYVD